MGVGSLPRPIGFVLGGGGSLGAMQVGMLAALTDREIYPDLVAGTSVGSLNGAIVALAGGVPVDRLWAIWTGMTRITAFPGGLIRQVRTLRQAGTHLFSNLPHVLGDHRVRGGRPGVRGSGAAAWRGRDGRRDGRARRAALRADPACPAGQLRDPGDLPRYRARRQAALRRRCGQQRSDAPGARDGRPIAGGARLRVPRSAARPAADPGRRADVHRNDQLRNQAVLEAPLIAREVPVVYLPGPAVHRVSALDFSHTTTLMDQAYQPAVTHLDSLVIDGPGLYGQPGPPPM